MQQAAVEMGAERLSTSHSEQLLLQAGCDDDSDDDGVDPLGPFENEATTAALVFPPFVRLIVVVKVRATS
jgi:hypothetical protein